jgi:hypothetical protein
MLKWTGGNQRGDPQQLRGNPKLLTILNLDPHVIFKARAWELISSGDFLLTSMMSINQSS